MPIYEYECMNCRTVRELWRSFSDPEVIECPECSDPLHKLVSQSSFQLKGKGWYADGYCGKSDRNSSNRKPADTKSCSQAGDKEIPMCKTYG